MPAWTHKQVGWRARGIDQSNVHQKREEEKDVHGTKLLLLIIEKLNDRVQTRGFENDEYKEENRAYK